jgi:hypothetical protein
MVKHIAALAFIYMCVCVAWAILGSTLLVRTYNIDANLSSKVEELWGSRQWQLAPQAYWVEKLVRKHANDPKEVNHYLTLSSSNVGVKLKLEQRKKGLLWYPTYRVNFGGHYTVENPTDSPKTVYCAFILPSAREVYDNLRFKINDKELTELAPENDTITGSVVLQPHEKASFFVGYESQGMYSWSYRFHNGVSQVKDFALHMVTDFDAIDFPDNSRSPTSKSKLGDHKKGWELDWKYASTMTGKDIGMSLPQLLNPGPWVSEVTFFGPVSLFFFYFVIWLISTVKSIRIHPMHYFFIGAAFFSFHLLMAYSVDHIPVEAAFVIASLVSVFLVLSYISRAVSNSTLVKQIAVAQAVYLVFFSYTFFLEQFTGLIITCMSIATLFVSMQYTARFNWSHVFNKKLAAQEQHDPVLGMLEQDYLT